MIHNKRGLFFSIKIGELAAATILGSQTCVAEVCASRPAFANLKRNDTYQPLATNRGVCANRYRSALEVCTNRYRSAWEACANIYGFMRKATFA